MLRAFVWLLSNVVSTLGAIFKRHTRDWHTDAASEVQLPASSDQQQETCFAENTGVSKALTMSSTRSVRPSNHEGVLTSGSVSSGHAFPARAGMQPARNALILHNHRLSSRKPRSGYPGPIRSQSESAKWFPARPHPEPVEGRLAGMTAVSAHTA